MALLPTRLMQTYFLLGFLSGENAPRAVRVQSAFKYPVTRTHPQSLNLSVHLSQAEQSTEPLGNCFRDRKKKRENALQYSL